MMKNRASTTIDVYGYHNAWSVRPGPKSNQEPTRCTVELEIQGDFKNGYHLVMSPEGFFTADAWFETIAEAKQSALVSFGINPDQWQDAEDDSS
ncbi:hypothetical protein OT109_05155 [Phycisphaeraceae bacterium D3-23]